MTFSAEHLIAAAVLSMAVVGLSLIFGWAVDALASYLERTKEAEED